MVVVVVCALLWISVVFGDVVVVGVVGVVLFSYCSCSLDACCRFVVQLSSIFRRFVTLLVARIGKKMNAPWWSLAAFTEKTHRLETESKLYFQSEIRKRTVLGVNQAGSPGLLPCPRSDLSILVRLKLKSQGRAWSRVEESL